MTQVNGRDPAWHNKVKIGALMERVRKHSEGLIEMTPTQLAAAKLFLSKTVPDLARVENKNDDSTVHLVIRDERDAR